MGTRLNAHLGMVGNHESEISDIAVGDAGRRGFGVFALRVFAWRNVRRGEEITIGYRLNAQFERAPTNARVP